MAERNKKVIMGLDSNVENLIYKHIKQSPLFYMFISSRELFHSNFWLWLSTLSAHKTAEVFGLTVAPDDQVEFKREYYHKAPPKVIKGPKTKIDLAILINGKLQMVIENKVKDFVTAEQLNRIKECFAFDTQVRKNEPLYTLVSLFQPHNHFPGWAVLSYSDLASKIERLQFTSDGYFTALINDYCQFARNLNELAQSLPISNNYDFAISHSHSLYNSLNGLLWEGYLKMRGGHFIASYNSSHNNYNICPSYHINNKKSTLHFPFELDNGYRIGVQIEDTQFRKFISCSNKKDADDFAHSLLQHELFFSSDPKMRDHKKVLNRYDPGFRYQYTKIPQEISQESLFEKINIALQFITDNLNQIKACIPAALKHNSQ